MGRALLVIALLATQAAAIIGVVDWRLAPFEMASQQLIPVAWPLQQEIPDSAVDTELQSEIERYVRGLDGRYGVAVRNLDDGRIARVNAEERFEAASMYKLLVMYRVLQHIERGDLGLSDDITIQEADTQESAAGYDLAVGEIVTVEQSLRSMITASSNSAAYALARTVGGWVAVDGAAQEIGMLDTDWDDGYWSTPDDIMHFFEALADRRLISQDASNGMVEILLQQEVNDRIPALLPEEVRTAHKTGELDNVRNDGGIVSTPEGRYVIVIMSYAVAPEPATQALAEISRLVYERYG